MTRQYLFVNCGETGRFANLGWPFWKVGLLCAGIGFGFALLAVLLGLIMGGIRL